MSPSHTVLIANGELEIVKITEDLYDQAVALFHDYFLKYENISIAFDLRGSPEVLAEMDVLFRFALNQRVSFAARIRGTNEIVATCTNVLLNPTGDCNFDRVFANFKTNNLKLVGEFLHRMENTYNIFNEWNIDCAFEVLFLSTRSDYAGKGLAATLTKHSVDYAKQMLNGTLPSEELATLPELVRHQRPKAVCSVLTSLFSQKIFEKLGSKSLTIVPYTELTFDGKSITEKIDPMHTCSIYSAFKL